MLLELINIKGGYTAGNSIIKGLNLSIDHGETLGIVGQNGAGSSQHLQLRRRALETRDAQRHPAVVDLVVAELLKGGEMTRCTGSALY